MDLSDLSLIAAIAEEGSLTRAAERLGTSLNATSRALARLEAREGITLVRRTTRSCALTEPGEVVYRRGLAILEQAEALRGDLAAFRDRPAGTVRVRLPASTVTAGLLQRLQAILGQHEGLQVQITVSRRDLLPSHDVDLALHVGELPDRSGLVARRVRVMRWVLCASPGYVARRGLPASVGALSAHDCVRYRAAEPETRWVLDHGDGHRESVPVGGVFESDDGRVLADATYGGLGIGILPEPEVRAGVAAGTLVAVLPDWSFAPPPVFLLVPRGRSRLPAIRTVAAALEAVLVAPSEEAAPG